MDRINIKTKYILFSIYVTEVLLKASIIRYFPSPWIFSDEQSYFGMAGKIVKGNFESMTNSHMPGYPLLISFTRLLSSTEASYKAILLFNVILSSCIIFVSFILFNIVLKVDERESILYSTIVSFLPQFIVYNYTIMSENLYTILFFAIVTIFFIITDKKFDSKLWPWILLGILVGFSPIVRSQSIILLIMFIVFFIINLLPRTRTISVKNYMISCLISIVVYVFFRFCLFYNVSSYSDLQKGYIDVIRRILSDFQDAFNFFQIFLGEISYLFAAIMFIPTFMLLHYLSKKDLRRNLRREVIYVLVFMTLFILANILITTLHASYVYNNLNIKTVYARYVDFIIPVIFAFGIVAIRNIKFSENKHRSYFCLMYLICLITVVICFFYKDNLFVNTFTIYIYQYLGDTLGRTMLCLIAILALIGLIYNKRKIVIVIISLVIILSVVPTLTRQIMFSNDTFNYYAPIGYWFDKNDIKDSIIDIDNQNEYSMNDSIDDYSNITQMDYVTVYSLLFWSNFYNKVQVKDINIDENHYIVSSRLLPRKYLTSSGQFILYDKIPQPMIELTPDLLYRFAKGFNNLPEQDWIWMNDRIILDNILIDDINQVAVEIELKGLYPTTLDKNVEVIINGESIGVQIGKENTFYFVMNSDEGFSVKSIEIKSKTWDISTHEYSQTGNGLGLDIRNIKMYLGYNERCDNISYYASDKLYPWKVVKSTDKILLYEKTFVSELVISPEMMSRYGIGFNGPEQDWNWVIDNGIATLDKIYLPDITKLDLTIELYGLWPKELEKEVDVYVNDEKIGQQKSDGNIFTFQIERTEKFDVDSITIKSNTWDPATAGYSLDEKGLGLDIRHIIVHMQQ